MTNNSRETDLSKRLRDRNLKATPARLSVLSVIDQYEEAVPYSKIQQSLDELDRVTLYRTMSALSANGVIHKALTEGSESYYALCSTSCSAESHEHKHVHFKCSDCNNVTCVELKHAITLEVQDHEIESYSLELNGRCKACLT